MKNANIYTMLSKKRRVLNGLEYCTSSTWKLLTLVCLMVMSISMYGNTDLLGNSTIDKTEIKNEGHSDVVFIETKSHHIIKSNNFFDADRMNALALLSPATASGSGINAAKSVTDVDDAVSGTMGNFDITFQITLQNTGAEPLININLLDTLDLNEHLGPAFVGISPGGDPVIFSSDADIDPTINPLYDGTMAQANIFLPATGLLQVGQSITVVFTAELNPLLLIDPEFIFNQATAYGTHGIVERCDMTDSGTDPQGSNPGADGDTGGVDDPTPIRICPDDCEIACSEQVHVSLDEFCETVITVGMVEAGIASYCEWQYEVIVSDEYGDVIPGNMVDVSMVGQNLDYWLTKENCSNSCEGKVLIEYKLPPQIDCPGDVTLACGALELMGLPTATGGCAPFEVFLFSETREVLQCDPLYTHIVERTYKAVDDNGNESVCSHTVYIERVDLSEIYFPESKTIAMGNAVSCSDPLVVFDENGVPVPWSFTPATGSGCGVPIQCDPLVVDGLVCPGTGDLTGVPLIPGEHQLLCNAIVLYTDIELPEISCVRKIMRTWEVREWWCTGENSRMDIQLIEIIDDEAPEFTCPPDFSVTTNDDCAGSVQLPPIDAFDECGHGFEVRIDYPNGFIHGNGGVAVLEVGENEITYIVNDECYNTDECTMRVTVSDDTEPVTICEPNTVVAISMNGNTITAAEIYDDGSWDECELDRFEVRRMDTTCVAMDTMFGEFISFCCSDVGQDVMVVFRAYDKGGNYNDCMVRVEVQDKIDPWMTCPDDVTIDCRESYDLNNLGVVFGNPVVTDNCMNLEDVFEITDADVNQCGIGEISRLFELRDEDGNVLRSCKQLIVINNLAPFVEGNIVWPLNLVVYNECGLNSLRPENLDEDFAFPRYTAGDDECSLLGYDYQDNVIEPVPGSGECAHIERTWTVINWCSQINGVFEVFEIPSPQIIELINTVAPVLVPMPDTVFESGNVDCLSGDIEMVREANDDCDNELFWNYEIVDTDGDTVQMGFSDTIRTELPVGEYDIRWRVNDGCGNFDLDTVSIEVRNTKSPSPVCMQGLSANIDQSQEVDVTTTLVDGGSYHTCMNEITLSMTPDTSVKSLTFYCNDVGLQMIQLWVTDVVTGAQDFCSTFIDIQDPDQVCPIVMNMVTVSGEVSNEASEMIEEVTVELDNADIYSNTDVHGYYAFENMPMGGSYYVTPKKDMDYLNGVSTLDLIMIQKHILGIQKLDSPYKLIAADVNNSQDISAIDLIELRKLILGVYQELPENDSWRFIDKSYEFPELIDPWVEAFPENYEIEKLEENMFIDFVGVKIGDVNGSAITNVSANTDIEQRSLTQLGLNVEKGKLKKGETRSIKFYSQNYDNIQGWQTTIEFPTEKIELLGIEPIALNLAEDNINMAGSLDGWISMSYHGINAETIDDVLFEAIVYAKADINISELFSTSSKVTRSEAYLSDGKIIDMDIENLANINSEILSVNPNPWVDQTEIIFEVATDGPVELEFYDVSGKLLIRKQKNYTKGVHQEYIKAEEIQTSGLIYVKMITEGQVSETKMLRIK